MKLQTRLSLAFLLVSVLPLSGVTAYTYLSSERAYRRAVEAEAASLAAEMGGRASGIAGDLDRRMERMSALPFPSLVGADPQNEKRIHEDMARRLQAELGDAAQLVESLEFTPVAPPPPPHPDQPAPPSAAVAGDRVEIRIGPGPHAESAPGHESAWVMRQLSTEKKQLAFALEVASAELAARSAGAKAVQETARAKEVENLIQKALEKAGDAGSRPPRWPRPPLGREFERTAWQHGAAVGRLSARIKPEQVFLSVLSRGGGRAGEIPFVVDAQGQLHASDRALPQLQALAVASLANAADSAEVRRKVGDWVVVTRRDPASRLTFGIARPVRQGLRDIRFAALRSFALGLGAIGLALVGIVPLSRRLTRDLARLTAGAEQLAQGDLTARVEVGTKDEVGRLASTFNRMAGEIQAHQERLVQQERMRKELELCRRIQEEMLPRDPLHVPFAEVKGLSIPAREVGGDFFNYFSLPSGEAALLVGDVAGKGVPAAILMANIQATLRARLPRERELATLAVDLDWELDASTPRSAYLTLFMAILDPGARRLRYVNAGQNPPILLRASGGLVRLDATGRPLGLLPGGGYEEGIVDLSAGDALFLYTDGLVESEDPFGEAFGLERLETLLQKAGDVGLDATLARVEEAVRAHRGEAEPFDDATMVILRIVANA
jgi:phosphoserine phosphatase RsbU/P